jgi:hypothetical protein
MKSKQAEHLKLTDEEVKELICDITVELHEIKQHFLEQLEVAESYIYQLKRHFCPEKFQEVQVSGQDLNDLLMSTYGNINVGEPMKFSKPEVNDGLAETE